MSAINDGGPAFPVWELNGQGQQEMTCFGMALRDYFAAHAPEVPGGFMRLMGDEYATGIESDLEWRVRWANAYADAMLAARAKSTGGAA